VNIDTLIRPAPSAVPPNRPDQAPSGPNEHAPRNATANNPPGAPQTRSPSVGDNREQTQADRSNSRPETELSPKEKRLVERLKSRDREVRAHEAAHKNVAGSLARGSAQFSFQTGPDGQRYAIGGEVSIDVSKVDGDPQATIAKAQTIRRAATAPAEPSSQDHAVTARASQLEAEARRELLAPAENETDAADPVSASRPESEREAARRPNAAGFSANSTQPTSVGELLDVIA